MRPFAGNLEAAAQSFTLCRDPAIGADDWPHEVNARLGLAWVLPRIESLPTFEHCLHVLEFDEVGPSGASPLLGCDDDVALIGVVG